jgi:hypothetical protein
MLDAQYETLCAEAARTQPAVMNAVANIGLTPTASL